MRADMRILSLLLLCLSTAAQGLDLKAAHRGVDLTPDGTQPGLTNALEPPGNCSFCHAPSNGNTAFEYFMPYTSWSGSMMANAGRDPVFWAALDVANNDLPNAGDYCLRCHAPSAWLAGRVYKDGAGGTVSGTDGCMLQGEIDQPNNDFSGVNCHLCHRMVNENEVGELAGLDNASFAIDDGMCSGQACRHGPYNYGAGEDTPPHAWAASGYHTRSAQCASCHNVTSPALTLIDETGTDTGIPYPIERTYMEWSQSTFGDSLFNDSVEDNADPALAAVTCQTCHMADPMDPDSQACRFDDPGRRAGNLPVHEFAGGNTWIPEVLRLEYGGASQLDRDTAFARSRDLAFAMLQNQSAFVAITAPAGVPAPGTLNATVRVTNRAGHKLPTGYTEGRRMWLQVTARDGNDQIIYQSGAYNAATGDLTEDDDIRIYETRRGIWNLNGDNTCSDIDASAGDRHVFRFVLNNCIVKDSRIPPEGFTGGDNPETQPVGEITYPETSAGSGVLVHWDDASYEIDVPGGTVGPISLEARLLFQTSSKEYIEFLRDEAVNESFPNDCIQRSTTSPGGIDWNQSRGEILYDMWTTYGRSAPVEMESDSASVVIGS